MFFSKGTLVLEKDDIDNFCKNCGTCCRTLTLEDKIELVGHFGQSGKFLSDICPFSSKYGCIKYKDRPSVCKDWTCGVVELLKESFDNRCRVG